MDGRVAMGQGASEVEPLVITRKRMMFVNTTTIAYGQKIGRSLIILVYAIVVVFTNFMLLRVQGG